MNSVLSRLTLNEFFANQSGMACIDSTIPIDNSLIFCLVEGNCPIIRQIRWIFYSAVTRSFTQIMNSSDPRMDSCGIPEDISLLSDFIIPNGKKDQSKTRVLRERCDWISCRLTPRIPQPLLFSQQILIHTVESLRKITESERIQLPIVLDIHYTFNALQKKQQTFP